MMSWASAINPEFKKNLERFDEKLNVTKFISLSQNAFKIIHNFPNLNKSERDLTSKALLGYDKDKGIISVDNIRAKILEKIPQEVLINVEEESKKLEGDVEDIIIIVED